MGRRHGAVPAASHIPAQDTAAGSTGEKGGLDECPVAGQMLLLITFHYSRTDRALLFRAL